MVRALLAAAAETMIEQPLPTRWTTIAVRSHAHARWSELPNAVLSLELAPALISTGRIDAQTVPHGRSGQAYQVKAIVAAGRGKSLLPPAPPPPPAGRHAGAPSTMRGSK